MKLDQWKIPRFYDENEVAFEHDHLVEEKDGGKTVLDNIVLSCRKCNRSRRRISKNKINELKKLDKEINKQELLT